MIRLPVVLEYLGRIIVIIGLAMLSNLIWAVIYHEPIIWKLLLSALITMALGWGLSRIFHTNYEINYREGFAVVALGWIAASLVGTIPFMLTGYIPSFADAFFETVSGFTTTGASILTDVEALPHSLLFWRSLTHWLGGMGIMVLFVSVMAGLGVRANQIFKAEVPGPVSDKLSPRIKETARLLWFTYMVMSLIMLILLIIFGMDIFNALCHTFGTLATGGFSTKNISVAYWDSASIQWTITIFMFLSGGNFALYYQIYSKRSLKQFVEDREFKLYAFITFAAVAIAIFGVTQAHGIEEHIRASAFQVVSIITTTGFATMDFDQWEPIGKGVLLLLMFVGGCAGSTAGGIKVGRYMIGLQRAKIELKQMVHPRAMIPQRFGDRFIHDSLVLNVLQFFFLYIGLVLLGTLCMNILGLDLISGLSATLACLGNIGPGFGAVGPMVNYAFIPDIGKYLLSLLMLLGRLEIYTFIVLLIPEFWKE